MASVWGIIVSRAGLVGWGASSMSAVNPLILSFLVLFVAFAGGAAFGHLVVWHRVLGGPKAAPPPLPATDATPGPSSASATAAASEATPKATPIAGGVEIYQSTLMHIWADGIVTEKEEVTLADLRERLGVSAAAHESLEREVKEVLFPDGPPTKASIYRSTLEQIWADGVVTPKEERVLEDLRRHLAVDASVHERMEAEVRARVAQRNHQGPDSTQPRSGGSNG